MGLVHGELTALLWAGAFGFVGAYTVAAGRLVLLSARARRPRGTWDVLPGPTLLFRATSLPPAPALFSWHLAVEAVHSPERRVRVTQPLTESVSVTVAWPRGRYQAEARWELRDFFGFTVCSPRPRWTTTVVVPPSPSTLASPQPPAHRVGTWHPRRTGRRAGDPFDVRRYTAGDDLRRLHWPLYAHAGLLFVRTADPSPPPAGRWHLVLDTEVGTEHGLDHRLGALARWLTDLDTRGSPWVLEVPAWDLRIRSGQDWPSPLAALSPRPWPEGWVPQSTDATLVTGPGSRSLGSWTAAPPVVVPNQQPAPVPRRPWWAR